MRPALEQLASPAVLALDIGLPKGTPLTSGGRDLDNYLFPIVARFGAARLVGPGRNWANLWKPAIDALGGVLGVDNPAKPFAPRDDRITDLGLQRSIDPRIEHAVQVDMWWRPTGRKRW